MKASTLIHTVVRPATALQDTTSGTFTSRLGALWPGLLLSAVVAAASLQLGKLPWLAEHGLSALTIAIVLGIVIGNTVYPRLAHTCTAGVNVSKQQLLRLGIILYGFRLTFQDVSQFGLAGVVIDALVLGSTFALALVLGVRVFKLERETAMLVGAGSAICGAAAVMASGPVVRARADQVTVAVSTVVVFGTITIFLYPALYQWSLQWSGLASTPTTFGVYAGSTIHEVAQVVAASRSIHPDAMNAAVVAKMVRVMMLAPFLIALSAFMARSGSSSISDSAQTEKGRLAIPWFAFAFIGMVGVNSMVGLPTVTISQITVIDTFLLAMAMGALGLTTHLSAIRRAGAKPLLLALCLFVWLIGGGGLINHFGMAWLG